MEGEEALLLRSQLQHGKARSIDLPVQPSVGQQEHFEEVRS